MRADNLPIARCPLSDSTVCHLRLLYEHGTVDEHLLWYAEDEVCLIPCAPESTSLPVRALNADTLIGFDPVGGTSYTVSLGATSPRGRVLEVSAWGG